jgi:hypothetical protein
MVSCLAYSSTLKMDAKYFSETSIGFSDDYTALRPLQLEQVDVETAIWIRIQQQPCTNFNPYTLTDFFVDLLTSPVKLC